MTKAQCNRCSAQYSQSNPKRKTSQSRERAKHAKFLGNSLHQQIQIAAPRIAVPKFARLALGKIAYVFRQVTRIGQPGAANNNRDDADTTFQRLCDFYSHPITRIIETTAPSCIPRTAPGRADYDQHNAALGELLGDVIWKARAVLQRIDVAINASSTELLLQAIEYPAGIPGTIGAAITDEYARQLQTPSGTWEPPLARTADLGARVECSGADIGDSLPPWERRADECPIRPNGSHPLGSLFLSH